MMEVFQNKGFIHYELVLSDEIGYRLRSENTDGKDDFQTEEDKENKRLFQTKRKRKSSWQNANFDDDKGFVLNLNFEDEENEEDEEDEENYMQEEIEE